MLRNQTWWFCRLDPEEILEVCQAHLVSTHFPWKCLTKGLIKLGQFYTDLLRQPENDKLWLDTKFNFIVLLIVFQNCVLKFIKKNFCYPHLKNLVKWNWLVYSDLNKIKDWLTYWKFSLHQFVKSFCCNISTFFLSIWQKSVVIAGFKIQNNLWKKV